MITWCMSYHQTYTGVLLRLLSPLTISQAMVRYSSSHISELPVKYSMLEDLINSLQYIACVKLKCIMFFVLLLLLVVWFVEGQDI